MDTEDLERYSLGDISEEQSARFEEHLLLCESCRRNVEETDLYVTSMSRAATQLRRQPEKRPQWRLIPVLAFAACVLLLAVLSLPWNPGRQPVIAVNLVATRANAAQSVPAGRPLWLHPDLTGLTPASSYALEIVDHNGDRIWKGLLAEPTAGARVPGQRAGTYFVRIYAPAGQLLREYGLEIK